MTFLLSFETDGADRPAGAGGTFVLMVDRTLMRFMPTHVAVVHQKGV
jgi:hypothetical protein